MCAHRCKSRCGSGALRCHVWMERVSTGLFRSTHSTYRIAQPLALWSALYTTVLLPVCVVCDYFSERVRRYTRAKNGQRSLIDHCVNVIIPPTPRFFACGELAGRRAATVDGEGVFGVYT